MRTGLLLGAVHMRVCASRMGKGGSPEPLLRVACMHDCRAGSTRAAAWELPRSTPPNACYLLTYLSC